MKMIHREGNHTWKRSLEAIPILIFIVGVMLIVLGTQLYNPIIVVPAGIFLLVILLIVMPYYASKAASLGIFGSPCRWGFHNNDVVGRNVVCRRCGKITGDYKY